MWYVILLYIFFIDIPLGTDREHCEFYVCLYLIYQDL